MSERLQVGRILHISIDSEEYLDNLLDKVEREVIKIAMDRCKGNQLRAAKQLGISRGSIRTKLKKYFGDAYFRNTIGG